MAVKDAAIFTSSCRKTFHFIRTFIEILIIDLTKMKEYCIVETKLKYTRRTRAGLGCDSKTV